MLRTCRICEDHPEEKHPCPLADEYEVQHRMITSPGKFEGECRYMPHFYDVMLDGVGGEQVGGIVSIKVTPKDKETYLELKKRQRVRFFERDDGFICEVSRC